MSDFTGLAEAAASGGQAEALSALRLHPREYPRDDETAGFLANDRGVPLLADVPAFATLWPYARLIVEIAWGADLEGDPTAWQWSDVSADVLTDGMGLAGIVIGPFGKPDGAVRAPSARLSMTLKNLHSDYTRTGQSKNWPNVHPGTPIRVSINLTGVPVDTMTYYWGEITDLIPGWDKTGGRPIVTVRAAGALLRIEQGTDLTTSALTRGLVTQGFTSPPFNSPPILYFPMEEPDGSDGFAEYFDRAPFYLVNNLGGSVDFGADNAAPGSLPLPRWNHPVAFYSFAGAFTPPSPQAWRFEFMLRFPQQPTGDCIIMEMRSSGGTVDVYRLIYTQSTGEVSLIGLDATYSDVLLDGGFAIDLDGSSYFVTVQFIQIGTHVEYKWSFEIVDAANSTAGTVSVQSFTGSPFTLGRFQAYVFISEPETDGITLGQIAVYTGVDARTDDGVSYAFFSGFDSLYATGVFGESAPGRMERLCLEQGIPLELIGVSGELGFFDNWTPMGPQTVDTVINLLRETEAADLGRLGDGRGQGIFFRTRRHHYNQTPALTFDISAGDVSGTLQPIDNTEQVGNKATASRKFGSPATYERTDGELGTDRIGPHNAQLPNSTINVTREDILRFTLEYVVGVQTLEGYRYRGVAIDLRRRPALAADVLALMPGDRMQISGAGIGGYVDQLPAEDLDLIAEGWTVQLSRFNWVVDIDTSRAAAYTVAVIEGTGGDASPPWRLDSASAVFATDVTPIDTSWSVGTPGGELLSTDAGDFPVDLDCEGEQVTATACSGASSPQTLTVTRSVNGVVRAHGPGARVRLWNPPGLAP